MIQDEDWCVHFCSKQKLLSAVYLVDITLVRRQHIELLT